MRRANLLDARADLDVLEPGAACLVEHRHDDVHVVSARARKAAPHGCVKFGFVATNDGRGHDTKVDCDIIDGLNAVDDTGARGRGREGECNSGRERLPTDRA